MLTPPSARVGSSARGRGVLRGARLRVRDATELAGPASVRGLDGLSRLAWSRYWAGDEDVARAALTTLRAELLTTVDSRLRRLLPQLERSLDELPRR